MKKIFYLKESNRYKEIEEYRIYDLVSWPAPGLCWKHEGGFGVIFSIEEIETLGICECVVRTAFIGHLRNKLAYNLEWIGDLSYEEFIEGQGVELPLVPAHDSYIKIGGRYQLFRKGFSGFKNTGVWLVNSDKTDTTIRPVYMGKVFIDRDNFPTKDEIMRIVDLNRGVHYNDILKIISLAVL